jgi:hypothetical protein
MLTSAQAHIVAYQIIYESQAWLQALREITELSEVIHSDAEGDIPEHIARALARDLDRIRALPEVKPCV